MSKKQIFEDMFNLVCGDLIGSGIHRDTFHCKLDENRVVKVQQEMGTFANSQEYFLWQDYQFQDSVSKWLAPCYLLSENGRVMIQHKTQPIVGELPKKLPYFLTDIKRENFGTIDGRVVCHDYSTIIVTIKTQMKNADW